MIEPGTQAPDFTLPQDGGEPVTLSTLKAPVVLYFYPKDDTSGCTKEAIGFSEMLGEFEALGVQVMGISRDPIKKHEKFRAKHNLTIPLLSDEETTVCELYGTWVEKKMYGKTYMGIERSTFMIGADQIVKQSWRKVKVAGHVEAVLEAAKML
ncbi:MAG: peroxiredoxin [Mangrovicoccus sp.]